MFFGFVQQARNKPADGHTVGQTAGAKTAGQKPSTKPTAQKGQVKGAPKAPPSANKPNKNNKKKKHQQHDLVVTINLVSTNFSYSINLLFSLDHAGNFQSKMRV